MGRSDEDPQSFDSQEAGLPAEAEEDLRAIGAVRARVGEAEWQRLMLWERISTVLAYMVLSVPLLLLITAYGTLRGELHPLVFLRKSRAAWETGDWVFAWAWVAAAAATLAGTIGRVAAGVALRRVAAEVKPPEMETEELVASADAAAFLEELRAEAQAIAKEEQQTEAAEEKLRAARRQGPVWWRVELSGAHLVWWIALALVLTHTFLHWPEGGLMSAAWGVLVSGIIFKVLGGGVGYFVVAHSPQTKLAMRRYYRWWGRGLWPLVIVAFFAFCGMGLSEAQREPLPEGW